MRNNLNIKALLFYTIIFIALSCNKQFDEQKNYPQDTTVSNPQGVPKDSMTFYFPSIIKTDSQFVKNDIKYPKWRSTLLYHFKEPILFNYFLGHEVYRFLWLRSFNTPMVFSLNKEGNNVWLIVKKLDVNYHDLITKPMGQAKIINIRKNLSIEQWNKFEQLLKDCNYWAMPPLIKNDMGVDGSSWYIEANLPGKYWFVDRWTPQDNFKKCGEYLIQLSGLKEDVY
jgi:hypothetical protein